jgi:hypothetical protein
MTEEREYVLTGDHAESLTSGRLIGPGDRVSSTELVDGDGNPIDTYLVDEGRLTPLDDLQPEVLEGEDLQARAAELKIRGRSNMSAEELRDAVAKREAEIAAEAAANTETPGGEVA